jgi:hypothetical protein
MRKKVVAALDKTRPSTENKHSYNFKLGGSQSDER